MEFNSMYRDLESRVRRLEQMISNESEIIFEGGASGHMKHIYDYTELTLNDIEDIITNLFSGKIEDVTEKLDGMNIQCALNNNGQVVFVRNKGDLNSKTGGMLQDDVAAKWAGREKVSKVYLSAYDTITKVFKKIGSKFFNPDKNTKILANCECIIAGKTNIMMYASAQVDFHNLWVYTRKDENSQWEKTDVITSGSMLKKLEDACASIDGAQLTPHVMIRVTEKSDELCDKYISQIRDIFKDAKCLGNDTIEDYKFSRFKETCDNKCKWISSVDGGLEILYNRWFNDDKSVNLREIKKMYKDHLSELNAIDDKQIVFECTRPLDVFFSKFGNSIISLCNGLVNAGAESRVINELRSDLDEMVKEIRTNGSDELKDKLTVQLNRLAELGDQINATEGIVFKYGDRLMKCTGSFAALNRAINLRFEME